MTGGRPECQFDFWPQPHHSPRHDVGTRVSEDRQRRGIFFRQQLQRNGAFVRHFGQRPHHVGDLSGHDRTQSGGGEARTDGGGDIKRRRVIGMVDDGTVWQLNLKHSEDNPVQRDWTERLSKKAAPFG